MYRIKEPIQTMGPCVIAVLGARHRATSSRSMSAQDAPVGQRMGSADRRGRIQGRGSHASHGQDHDPDRFRKPGGQDGSIGGLIQSAAERWKPEAMYFGTFDGHRTAFMVFDMPDSSDMVPFVSRSSWRSTPMWGVVR